MATVSVSPITLKNATLTVASDDYTAAVTSVTFEPSAEWEWVDSLLGNSYPLLSRVRWECSVEWLQDMTASSLTRYLLNNTGKVVTVVFTPVVGKSVTATVMLVPGSLGGGVENLLTSTASLPVSGSPTVA